MCACIYVPDFTAGKETLYSSGDLPHPSSLTTSQKYWRDVKAREVLNAWLFRPDPPHSYYLKIKCAKQRPCSFWSTSHVPLDKWTIDTAPKDECGSWQVCTSLGKVCFCACVFVWKGRGGGGESPEQQGITLWRDKHQHGARNVPWRPEKAKVQKQREGSTPVLAHWDTTPLVACPGMGTKTVKYSPMGAHCHSMLPDNFGKPHIYFMHGTPKELCGQNSFSVLDQTESPQTLGYYLEKEMYIFRR